MQWMYQSVVVGDFGSSSVSITMSRSVSVGDCTSSTNGSSTLASPLPAAMRCARSFRRSSRNLNTPSTMYVIVAAIPLICNMWYIPWKTEKKNSKQINKTKPDQNSNKNGNYNRDSMRIVCIQMSWVCTKYVYVCALEQIQSVGFNNGPCLATVHIHPLAKNKMLDVSHVTQPI